MTTIVTTTVTTLLDSPFWFYRKLKISHAEKYPDSRENRLHDKNSSDSKVFGFKVSTINSGLKISGDKSKLPGSFYLGSVPLCVNGKIRHESGTISSSVNLVLKKPDFCRPLLTELIGFHCNCIYSHSTELRKTITGEIPPFS